MANITMQAVASAARQAGEGRNTVTTSTARLESYRKPSGFTGRVLHSLGVSPAQLREMQTSGFASTTAPMTTAAVSFAERMFSAEASGTPWCEIARVANSR